MLILCCGLLLSGCAQPPEKAEDGRLQVVAAVFPAYDFARAAGGGLADVELLLPPGAESHSYEPTPADILAVQECDLFIYLGGESDTWVETILSSIDMEGRTLRMVDCVELLEETEVEGMQALPGHRHDHEDEEGEEHGAHGLGVVVGMDEHVWTSPRNAAAITRTIGGVLGELDPANAPAYTAAAEQYAGRSMDWMESSPPFLKAARIGPSFLATGSRCCILQRSSTWTIMRPSRAAAPRQNRLRPQWPF